MRAQPVEVWNCRCPGEDGINTWQRSACFRCGEDRPPQSVRFGIRFVCVSAMLAGIVGFVFWTVTEIAPPRYSVAQVPDQESIKLMGGPGFNAIQCLPQSSVDGVTWASAAKSFWFENGTTITVNRLDADHERFVCWGGNSAVSNALVGLGTAHAP